MSRPLAILLAGLFLPASIFAQDSAPAETPESTTPTPPLEKVEPAPEVDAPQKAIEPAPETETPMEETTPAEPVTYKQDDHPPFVGEVTAKRVNVRAGPTVNHRILKVATVKDRLVVVGRKVTAPGSVWYQIDVPGDTWVWISAKFLKVEEGAGEGEVIGSNVLLRATDKATGDILGKTYKGEKLKVKRKLGPWYEVQAPSRLRAWIYGKYVKPTTLALPTGKLRLIEAIQFKVQAEMAKEEYNPKSLLDWLVAKKAELKDPQEMGYVDSIMGRLEKVQEKQAIEDELARLKKDLADQMDMIEETARREIDNINAPTEPTKVKVLPSGYIRSYLSLWKAPATHKLVKGGKVLYLLKSAVDNKGKPLYDLSKYFSRHVEIDGKKIELKGYPILIEVTDIRILK